MSRTERVESPVHVELQVVPGCPNEPIAVDRLREVLDEAGLTGTAIDVRVVTLDTVADEPRFGGSPTVLLDGVDPFTDDHAGGIGLSCCRVYRTPAGAEGAPSVEQIRRAVSAGRSPPRGQDRAAGGGVHATASDGPS